MFDRGRSASDLMCNVQKISFPKDSLTKIDPTSLRFLLPSGGTIYLVKLGSG
jgi:hypothetical protein